MSEEATATMEQTEAVEDVVDAPVGDYPLPQEIIDAEKECGMKEWRYKQAKNNAKSCKEDFEGAVDNLRKLVKEHSEPSLFKKSPDDVDEATQEAPAVDDEDGDEDEEVESD